MCAGCWCVYVLLLCVTLPPVLQDATVPVTVCSVCVVVVNMETGRFQAESKTSAPDVPSESWWVQEWFPLFCPGSDVSLVEP